MTDVRTLGLILAVAALLPAYLVALRRDLPLRVAEVVHVVAAALLLTYGASAVHGLGRGASISTFGDLRQPLAIAVLVLGALVGLVAWWTLHARPLAERTAEDSEADEDDLEDDVDGDDLDDEDDVDDEDDLDGNAAPILPPLPALPVVPRVLFVGGGLACLVLLGDFPFLGRFSSGHYTLTAAPIVYAVVTGLVLGLALLAPVFSDDESQRDPAAYVAFLLVVGAAALEGVAPELADPQWVDLLLGGLSVGLLAPAALDVLGDLTSAVRPYALPVGVAIAAALLGVSSLLISEAVDDTAGIQPAACHDVDDCEFPGGFG